MSADRCPSCAAAVRPDASWCGLCYADLRPPAPAAPVQTAPAPVVPTQGPPTADAAVNAPVTLVADPPAADPFTDPVAAASPGVVPVVPTPSGWPCARCGELVPFTDDECPDCHARFLESPLPGGDRTLLDRLPQGQRKASTAFMVMLVGGLGMTGVFVALFALIAFVF